MRALTDADRAVLSADARAHHLAVDVIGPDGTWVDLTTLLGDDWVIGASWGRTIDEPVADCRIRLRRAIGTDVSLAPLVEDSAANRDALGAYAPLIDAGRAVRVRTATTEPGRDPASGDWRIVFEGVIDRVGWAQDPLEITARDPGGHLVDRWVEEEREYGAQGGRPIEAVMQDLLDDWTDGVVLWSPNGTPTTPFAPGDAPGFMVNPYRQQKQSVHDALQALAQLIGWVVRYRWHDAAGAHVLTLYEPDRQKTTPDHTFGPDDYAGVTRLDIDRAHVRNAISVIFTDGATGQRDQVTAEDAASIARYGRRWMEIEEASDSPIDSEAEAQAMADAALADLRLPAAEQEIETLYFWPVELEDLYAFEANGVHYDTDQQWAVVGYRHELEPGRERTILTVRGAPAGMYRAWIGRAVRGEPGLQYAECRARIVASDATTVTVEVEAVPPDGTVQLVSVHGATRTSGPVEGVASPSGTQWKFQRGTVPGQAVFRAEADGYQSREATVGIPELAPDVPVQALPPLCDLEVSSLGPTTALIEVTGVARTGGTMPTQYARREYALGATPPAWGAWQNLTNGTASYTVARGTGSFVIAEAKVRDAAGRESAVARVEIEPAGIARHGDPITQFGERYAANVYRSAADPTPLSNIVQRIGADGNAVNTFGIAEGTTVHRIFRHREEVTAFGGVVDGEVQVDFVDEYQNAPAVSLRGHSCISYHASLGSGVSQRLVIQAVNVSKDGFVSRAVIKNTGATTMHNNDFPSGNLLDAVGETTEVTLNPGGANDDRYTVRYAVSVTAVRTDNPAEVNPVTVVVAIDTDDGTGPIERAAFSYTAVGTENVTDVKSWPNEEKTITVSGLGSGDKIRLRIKSIVSHPPYLFDVAVQGADGAGSNPGSARGVSYTTASDTTLSAVPDPGDFIEWLAQEVV